MIVLPSHPAPRAAAPIYLDFGGFLTPALGGEVMRIDRLGNRFGLAVTMPPMPSDDLGRIWVSRLLRGKTEGARLDWPLLDFDPGSPGAPKVDGNGQAGRTLALKGMTPAYAVREGQWFSLVRAGRRYLYNVDADAIVAGDGTVSLSISPMLRSQPVSNDVCEFAQPRIEGFIQGEDWRWQMSLAHHLGIEFEILERS